ncbi:MAG: hypothetical protein RBS37_05985 [Bacteroidales bacterium]|jgi:hypothetical protein|nr:hypothetical protein [Bacteroidales bacterium]
MKKLFFSGIAVVMLVLMAGCGKLPQAQIDAANAAIEAAKEAQADIYLPAEFAGLQDSLNVCLTEVEAQKSKFFKSFGDVTTKLEAVAALGTVVKDNAAVKKEEVRVQTETLMNEVNTLVAGTKELLAKAPKGKEGAAALEEIKTEISVIEASVTEAGAAFTGGQFMAANEKLKAAMENISRINTELSEAIAKVTRR